jgi:ABC-type nitrate/sulfonate/bicarbonate transport system permease component
MVSVLRRIPPGLVSAVVALAAWQLLASYGPLSESTIPTASESLQSLWQLLGESSTWLALWQTLQMAVIGFVIALLIAIPVGVLIGLSRFAYMSTKFTFDFFKVIPPIVIIPITILVFGPTIQMGVFLVVFAIVFALAIQTAYGVRDADPVLLDTMRAYGLGVIDQVRHGRLPSAAPFIAVGVRISATAALIVAVVAGLIGGAPGLGRELQIAQAGGQSARTFALVLLLGILGVIVSRGITVVQRRMAFWVPV